MQTTSTTVTGEGKASRMAGYRLLGVMEVLRHGDEYRDPHNGKWYPTKCEGKTVGLPGCTSAIYRRREAN